MDYAHTRRYTHKNTLREFELEIGIAEHILIIHISAHIVKLKNVGTIQKSMWPFEKMPL